MVVRRRGFDKTRPSSDFGNEECGLRQRSLGVGDCDEGAARKVANRSCFTALTIRGLHKPVMR